MTTDSLSGLSSAQIQQSISSQVVSSTLDTMNGQGSGSAPITDKASFGAAVVSKTLDYMNSGSLPQSDMEQSYSFNKDVLGAYASGIGSLADVKV